MSIGTAIKLAPWALAAIFCALFLFAKLQTKSCELGVAVKKIAVVVHENEELKQTIYITGELRKAGEDVVSKFILHVDKINTNFNAETVRIFQLRQVDETVNSYLATPIPIALRDILNGVQHP